VTWLWMYFEAAAPAFPGFAWSGLRSSARCGTGNGHGKQKKEHRIRTQPSRALAASSDVPYFVSAESAGL
ncbi:MAG: hypothetical protein O2856_13960, partial [Planctomycetota bacterium]|nr:hypothetical protein [Planctomycetota bacterium]